MKQLELSGDPTSRSLTIGQSLRQPEFKDVARLVLLILFFLGLVISHSKTVYAFNPKEDILEFQKADSLQRLKEQSEVITKGQLGPAVHTFHLEKKRDSYQFINKTQFITIEKVWKGKPSKKIELLMTGLTPLPAAKSPLNLKYPGELAEGEYIFFLKHVPDTPFYQLTTGMQSLYPVIFGHTIALKDPSGFQSLDHLTISQFAHKIKK